jgi:hypothetical protein
VAVSCCLESLAGPTASKSLLLVYMEMPELQSVTLVLRLVAALTSAWRENPSGYGDTCCTTTCKAPAYRMVETCKLSVNQHYVPREVAG